MDVDVRDNPAEGRFEAEIDGLMAVADYHIEGGSMVFTHFHVPAQFRNQGIGEDLARTALDAARARGMHIVPRCPFMASFVDEHPEYHDLLKS
jgi:uncharacterized protein